MKILISVAVLIVMQPIIHWWADFSNYDSLAHQTLTFLKYVALVLEMFHILYNQDNRFLAFVNHATGKPLSSLI